jgi:hypothetical protein
MKRNSSVRPFGIGRTLWWHLPRSKRAAWWRGVRIPRVRKRFPGVYPGD